MPHSSAPLAAGGENGERSAGPPPRARRPPDTNPPQSAPGDLSPAHDESDAAGYTVYRSKKNRRKDKQLEVSLTPNLTASASDSDSSGPPLTRPQHAGTSASLPAAARTNTKALEAKIFRLRDHLRLGADDQAVVDALARVQRSFRHPAAEAKQTFLRTYDSEDATHRASIARTLRGWFTGPRPISFKEFLLRLTQFRLLVPESAMSSPKKSWRKALLEGADSEVDGTDDEPMPQAATPAAPQLWAQTPRNPSSGELHQLADIAHGKQLDVVLPSFIKDTTSVTTAAFLATVATTAQRGTLAAMLGGMVTIPARSSHSDIMRMLSDGATGPSKLQVNKFKSAVLAARHDEKANAIIFTLATVTHEADFAGTTVPIMGRMIMLQRTRRTTDGTMTGPCGAVVDLDVYNLQVWNLNGQLDALNVWHVFHGLLRLKVTHLELAPAAASGIQDLTLWNVAVASRGCPTALTRKTKIVWGEETLWIHHTAHHTQPPCTKCGNASHTARGCTTPAASADHVTIKLAGDKLDATADMAEAKRVGPTSMGKWLQDLDTRLRNRSRRLGGGTLRPHGTGRVAAPPSYHAESLKPGQVVDWLLEAVRASPWLSENKITGAAVSAASLQDLLFSRMRSKEWRATVEYVQSKEAFRDRVSWTEARLELGPKFTRLYAIADSNWWLQNELQYRLDPPAATETPGLYDETLAFFMTIMNRPVDTGNVSAGDVDMDDETTTPPVQPPAPQDPVLDTLLRTKWEKAQAKAWAAHAAETEATRCAEETTAAIIAEVLSEMIQDITANGHASAQTAATGTASQIEGTEPAGGGGLPAAPLTATVPTTSVAAVAAAPATATALTPAQLRQDGAAMVSTACTSPSTDATAVTETVASEVPVATLLAPSPEPAPEHQRRLVVATSSLQRAVAIAAAQDEHWARVNNPFSSGDRASLLLTASDMGNASHVAAVGSVAATTDLALGHDLELFEDMDDGYASTEGDHAHAPVEERRLVASSGRYGKRQSTPKPLKKRSTQAKITAGGFKTTIVKAQVGIQQFLKKAAPRTDMEVEFLGVCPAPAPPAHLPLDWDTAIAQMGLREFNTPANGSCWAYAAYCTQWGLLDDNILPVGVAKREAGYYRTGIFGIIAQNYDELVETQVISEASLGYHFLGTPVLDEASRGLLHDEIARAGSSACDVMLEPRYWIGTDGVRVTSLWVRQPVLIFDRREDGGFSAQLHALARLSTDPLDRRETIKTTLLEHAEVVDLLAAYERARVIPLVAALNHVTRHFTGLRVEESRYQAHALLPSTRAAMKRRLGTLLKSRGMYSPPLRPATPLLVKPFATQESDGSLFTPTSSASSESDSQLVPMRGPGAREMVRLATEPDAPSFASQDDSQSTTMVVWTRGFDAEGDERKTDTELHDDDIWSEPPSPSPERQWASSQASSCSYEAASVPLFQASLVTPLSPLDDEDYVDLLAQISRSGPVPVADEVALKKTMRDNHAAYTAWKLAASPGTRKLLANTISLEAACEVLLHDTTTILSLLRALPCVPVLAGRVRRDLFQRIGKDLIALGRARMLDRLAQRDDLTLEAKDYCATWARGFAGLPTAAARFSFAQSQDRWERLKTHVPSKLRPLMAIPDLDMADWGALLAHLLVCPSALRDQVARWRLPDACDALLTWTANPRRSFDTVAAAQAFQSGRWRAPTDGNQRMLRHLLGAHHVTKGASAPLPSGTDVPDGLGRDTAVNHYHSTTATGVEWEHEHSVAATSSSPVARGPVLQLLTQNVRGLAKTADRPAGWFSGLRALHNGGLVDAVLLQETRATEAWAPKLADGYARAWGLDPAKLDTPLSYWHPTPTAAGGVAILLHPQSKLRAMVPLWEDLWDSHFMAITGTVDGSTVTVACLYAPVKKRHREQIFRRLSQRAPPGGLLLLGGDFNCVLDEERDRSRAGNTNTDSMELRRLMEEWQLVDSIAADQLQAQSHEEIQELHAHTHTFTYRLRNGGHASSRLDRWYVSKTHYAKVASTQTSTPASPSDHDAVLLVLTPTGRMVTPTRSGRRALVYPLPAYAVEAVRAVSAEHVLRLRALGASSTPLEAAAQWDALKTELRRTCLVEQRLAGRRLTNSINQRIRRARRALDLEQRRSLLTQRCRDAGADAVATITARMELLTLDAGERVVALRRHLILLQHEKAMRRQRRAIHRYDGHDASATRAFYQRMSKRFSKPRVIGGTGSGHDTMPATRLVADWLPVIQQHPVDLDAQDAFFAQLGRPATVSAAAAEFDDFTVAEVQAAIKACPAGKASGPDGIPNDWYLPVAETLAPTLAGVFSGWVRAGVLPPSFKDATIFCLPKTASPKNGLDYRPISLLNTDYKILSRMILQRIQGRVSAVVSAAQFGFVATRQVHDAIDVWEAVQALVTSEELPPTTTAVMLDFAKAYDTLDRGFLRRALVYHGFAPHVIRVVDEMHLATTARFLADGDLSASVDILNGIRQGCPLAPVLFVLALDLLYRAADNHAGLAGLRLDPATRVTLCGYADDTTAYLVSPDEEPTLLELLAGFGAASGLKINVKKSCAIAVHPHGPTREHAAMQIPVLAKHDLHRHLGMAVASAPSSASIWARTLQQVRASLHAAHVKTTNLLQRVALCNAVIMPKLLFVGRHAWPTGPVFDQLQRFLTTYAWHASLTQTRQRKRAWMSSTVAMLPVAAGGLGLPDVRAAFSRKSVVARWCTSTNAVAAAAGGVLMRLRGGGPERPLPGACRLQPPPPRISATLAATGVAALRASSTIPRDDAEVRLLHHLLPVHGRGKAAERWWDNGWYYCDYAARAPDLAALRAHQHHTHGDFNMAALLAAPIVGGGVLYQAPGIGISRRDFRGFFPHGATVGDVLAVERVGRGLMRFRCHHHPWPIAPRFVFLFRRLCDLVVHNYPDVLLPHNEPDELQPRPPSEALWRTRVTARGTILVHEPVPGRQISLGPVHTMAAAAKLARVHDPALLRFDPHPSLDAFAPLWIRRRPHPDGSPSAPAAVSQALLEVASRARRAIADDRCLGLALGSVSWAQVARLRASASGQRLLYHKIKGLRLSGWDRAARRRGCPHCPAVDSPEGGHTFHIVWRCAAAQELWSVFQSAWGRLGTTLESDSKAFATAVFSLRLPQTPAIAWAFLGLSGVPVDLIPNVHEVVAVVWQQQVLGCLQRIWQWRNSVNDEELPWTRSIATAAARSALDAAYQQAQLYVASKPPHHRRQLQLLLLGLRRLQLGDAPIAAPREAHSTDHYLLFFDGGSRGNPGPGGAGAVVIRVDALGGHPQIVWAAAMSLANRTTTNNQAEYFGLLTGLRFTSKRRLRPLTIIGDSAMILAQMRNHKAPKDAQLRRLYGQARILADVLAVQAWCHHLRAYNKMADSAANMAMDTRRSFQTPDPTAHQQWARLTTHLHNDVEQWQASTHHGPANAG